MVQEAKSRARAGGSPGLVGVSLAVLLVAGLGGLLLATAAWIRPLWYDEYFTYYVSRLASPAAVAEALMTGADNGPPLDYWLRHWSLSLFGDSALALRLPSIAAFLVTSWAVASIARARFGATTAAMALVALSLTVAPIYAVEARSYASLLACMSVALWAWQRAIAQPSRRRYTTTLFLALFLSPLTHYYGVLNYLPVFAAELFVVRRAPRCGRRWMALLMSLSSVAFLPAFAHNAWAMREHFWAATRNPWSVVDALSSLVGACALLLVALVVLWFRSRPRKDGPAARRRDVATDGVQVAMLVLLTMPAIVYVSAAMFTNAMAYRYALIFTVGVALLAAWLMAPLENLRPRVTRVLVMGSMVATLVFNADRLLRSDVDDDVNGLSRFLHQNSGDLVIENAQTFLQFYHELGAGDRPRLLYLSDAELSVQYLGYDTDEIALPKLRPYARFQLEAFESYLRRQPEFLIVVAQPPRWVSKELERRHYLLEPVAQLGGRTIQRATPPSEAR